MNEPSEIRKKVREVLALHGRRRLSEQMIFEAIRRTLPGRLTADEFNAALQWNLSRRLIAAEYNEDEEREEYFIGSEVHPCTSPQAFQVAAQLRALADELDPPKQGQSQS